MKFFVCLLSAAVLTGSVFSARAGAVAPEDLPEGLVAYWVAGDEGSRVPDLSGHGHHGRLEGEAVKPERMDCEIFGKTIHFSHAGSEDGPSVPVELTDKIRPPSPEMTIAAWVKLDEEGEGANNYILSAGGVFRFKVRWGRPIFRYRSEDDDELLNFMGDPEIFRMESGDWHLLAVSHDGETLNLYVDGKKIFSEEAPGYPRRVHQLTIGNFAHRRTVTTFRGKIGPVMLFNRALGESELYPVYLAWKPYEQAALAEMALDGGREPDERLNIIRMLLSDEAELLKVALGAESPELRSAAVGGIKDGKLLARIDLRGEHRTVRLAAAGNLTDQAELARIAMEDGDEDVRAVAVKNLSDQILLRKILNSENNRYIRMAALSGITDQQFLAETALNDGDEKVRLEAVKNISDETSLRKIAEESDLFQVQMLALRKLSD